MWEKMNSRRPWIIGHRGAKGEAPENTLKSFRRALQAGVDFIECDLRLSREGIPVVVHDAEVEISPGKREKVKNLTWEELKSLDVGEGERIPCLREVITLSQGKTGVIVEIKDPQAWEVIKEEISGPGILIASFHTEVIERVFPASKRILLIRRREKLYEADRLQPEFVGLPHPLVEEEVMRWAEARSIKILAWTVNEEKDLERMLEIGVPAIATDYPTYFMEVLRKRGLL